MKKRTINRIILTGATGMIGVQFICICASMNIEVYAICRKNSVHLDRIKDFTNVHIIDCGLEGMADIGESDIPKSDVFCHLGWEGTTGAARNDMQLQLGNVRYTLDAVGVAQKVGCKVFVGAGSQAEYGRAGEKLCESTPAFPESGYGMAKLCAGQMSRWECERHGIKHVWARFLSVYGPYDTENSMINQALRNIIAGKKPVFTKGEQYWDYLYCEDAAKALFSLCENGKHKKVYCIGSGISRRLTEYIKIIAEQTGFCAEMGIGEISYAENQVMYLCADITELRKDTGFQPEISFDEGIRKTVMWIKKCENF